MNPEWLKYIKEGDVVVLGVILSLVIIFYRYRIPSVAKRLEVKVGKDDCEKLRGTCSPLLLQRISSLENAFEKTTDQLNKRLDDIRHEIKENREVLVEFIRNGR